MKITQAQVEMEPRELACILTDAIETGAIRYWANDTDEVKGVSTVRDSELNVVDIGLQIVNAQGEPVWHHVTPEKVQASINKLLADAKTPGWLRNQILREDLDAGGTDYIIQDVVFGQQVYA